MRDLSVAGVAYREDMSPSFWQEAGALKAVRRRVSLADCFALTLTRKLGGSLLTTDHHELDALADSDDYSITFIR